MFRVSQRPSSGGLKTVTATSGIGHNTGTPVLWAIPEVAVTVFSTPDDGRCDARKWFSVNKRSNLMQQYADIYLLQSHSTYFGRHSAHHQED